MIDLRNGDCLQLLTTLADNSVDAVITDPPYTDGKGVDVLSGHKIQTKINIDIFFTECFRILKDDSFIAFFGQMPTIIAWHDAAIKAGFRWKQDIVWAKRMITSPYSEIQRTHEYIYIYTKGKAKFANTTARMEDLKTPALHMGLYELSTIKTLISDLQRRLVDRKYDDLYFSKMPTPNGAMNGKTNDTMYQKQLGNNTKPRKKDDLDYYCEDEGLETPERPEGYTAPYANSDKRNDKHHQNIYGKKATGDGFRYRSKWYNNVTNLWSFLPENQTKFNKDEFNVKHPTVKPIRLLQRLVQLLTIENQIVIDPFLGSGTTGIAAVNLNRNFIGFELDKDYFAIAEDRINKSIQKQNEKLF